MKDIKIDHLAVERNCEFLDKNTNEKKVYDQLYIVTSTGERLAIKAGKYSKAAIMLLVSEEIKHSK